MNDEEPITENAEESPKWAAVEIFGHRKHVGRITEVEQFGSKMLRIDVPKSDLPDAEFVSHFYGGASIFGITYVDEATARKLNRPYTSPYLAQLQSPDDDPFDPEDQNPNEKEMP